MFVRLLRFCCANEQLGLIDLANRIHIIGGGRTAIPLPERPNLMRDSRRYLAHLVEQQPHRGEDFLVLA